MSGERVTLIISDLHVGGGSADKGEDHIYQNDQLVRLLREQLQSAEGRAGRLELIINGDFLEFAQTNQAAFSHPSDDYWCSEPESVAKLETILQGHPDIFAQLAEFQKPGNLVTIAAGNHDVDLYWPKVQARLRGAAGSGVQFQLGTEWYERYAGKLQVSHGHMKDPANTFKHWDQPIREAAGTRRLEMCPGTLFMVKFVNPLESRYPFADNLQPVTRLAAVLAKDEKAGLVSVAWMFTRFTATAPLSVLGGKPDNYGEVLLKKVRTDRKYAERLAAALAAAGVDDPAGRLAADQLTTKTLAALMFQVLGRISEEQWRGLFELPPATLGANSPATLKAIADSNSSFDKKFLQELAQKQRNKSGASVIVMGHTHQHDEHKLDGGVYYNPGSWTRYLELAPNQKVRLADLVDESKFPYRLNYVRVWPADNGNLGSEMVCFEKSS
jgi:UDP-2,3-diacylglucosamine pyrophosphatase LpxH